LKHTESTVFLVIPPEYLDTHSRYLRLFITLALRAAGRGRRAKHHMLFILDEFAALGELKILADTVAELGGMGVKLWPIIQNLTQLRPYGENWEVFLSNAGQHQIFAVNDQTTARYFSERLGEHIAWREVRMQTGRGFEYEWTPHAVALLRTGPELARESSRDSEKAVILFEGGDAALELHALYDPKAYFARVDSLFLEGGLKTGAARNAHLRSRPFSRFIQCARCREAAFGIARQSDAHRPVGCVCSHFGRCPRPAESR
jgi:type IV secretion system protein VirD4